MKGLGTRLHTGWFLAGASDRLGHAYVDFAEESQAEVHCLALPSSWVAPRFQVQCEAQESVCRGASLTVRVCRVGSHMSRACSSTFIKVCQL